LIKLDKVRASVASFLGYMKHCDGVRSIESVLWNAVYKKG
jgi:hypothetical protein